MKKHIAHVKLALFIVLVTAMLTALALLIFSPQGQAIRQDPGAFRQDVQTWVADHPISAPLVYVVVYVLMTMLAMPVWWLQVMAGYGFGFTMGVAWSAVAAAMSAGLTVQFSHFLIGEYFHEHVEMRLAKLHNIMEKVGHNGFLTVLAIRLMHIVPFGLSNYIFGLTAIKPLEAALGALIGGTPSTAAYVAMASPYRSYWQFWAILVAINVGLILPFIIHWRRNHRHAPADAQPSPGV